MNLARADSRSPEKERKYGNALLIRSRSTLAMKSRKCHLIGFLTVSTFIGVLVMLGMRPGEAQLKFHGFMQVQLQGNPMTAAVFSFRPRLKHARFLQVNETGTGMIRVREGTDWGAPIPGLNTVEYDNLNGTRIVLIPAHALERTWRYDRIHDRFVILKAPNARPRVLFKRKVLLTSGDMEAWDPAPAVPEKPKLN
jgi:hypothetical protein